MMVHPLYLVMAALSLISLNVNGVRDSSKRAGLVQWLRSLSVVPDIICLQETHCVSLDECRIWFSSSGYLFAVSRGSVKSCGCIILFRPSLSLVNSWCDSDGRFLQCEFSFLGKTFRVACVYAPNRNPAHDQFLDELHTRLDPLIPTVLDISCTLQMLPDGSPPGQLFRRAPHHPLLRQLSITGRDSIATTISRGSEALTTLAAADICGHCFSALLARIRGARFFTVFCDVQLTQDLLGY